MTKKRQTLGAKLGSWTDLAGPSQSEAPPSVDQSPATEPAEKLTAPQRETYGVARGLIERLAERAVQQGMSQNELVGYLLTWALDQVDAGAHTLPTNRAE